MKNALRALAFLIMLLPGVAAAQCNSSTPLPVNTVLGRLGVTPGPCQAIPFATLLSNITGTPTSRILATTAPLAGGGNLTIDRTLSINSNGIDSTLIANNAVTFAKFQQLAALSMFGNCTNALANGAAVTGTANQVLRVNGAGTSCGFGTIDLSQSASVANTLPFTNLPTLPADNIAANPTAGAAVMQALALVNCSNALIYSTSTHTFGCNAVAGTGTVTSAQISAGSGITVTTTAGANPCIATCNLTIAVNQSVLANSLSGDVALNNVSNFIDGPIIAQGTTGTWWVSGTVTLVDTAGAAQFNCRMTDNVTIIASGAATSSAINTLTTISLSGYLATPAASIRISCKDITSTSGKMLFNQTGNSKDSTVSAHRVQ